MTTRNDVISDAHRDWIESASYESLLRRWRSAPVGDPIFQGATGDFYSDAMKRKREEVGGAEHVRASKSIGWDG